MASGGSYGVWRVSGTSGGHQGDGAIRGCRGVRGALGAARDCRYSGQQGYRSTEGVGCEGVGGHWGVGVHWRWQVDWEPDHIGPKSRIIALPLVSLGE